MLICEDNIRKHLTSKLNQQLVFHILSSVDSTNQFLKDNQFTQKIHICTAETQTHGRGRFGRTWHSPAAENIYLSALWSFSTDYEKLSGLSLVIGLAVIEVLKEYDLISNVKIKWPNDLLWYTKKLCGILIEILPATNPMQLIIGIGLNVNSVHTADQASCSLLNLTNEKLDRNILIAKLLIHLQKKITQLISYGLKSFIDEWQLYDYLYNKTINVTHAGKKIQGTAQGIDILGRLIVKDACGFRHYLLAGETSLQNNF